MAGRLAAVPEESTISATPPSPPHNVYRDSIRRVAVSGGRTVSISIPSRPGCSADSGSGPSDSSASKTSGASSASTCAAPAVDLSAHELAKIARRMISDGYTQRVVWEYGGGPDSALEAWFLELDVDWVLKIPEGHCSRWQLQLRDDSESSVLELAERWIRAFVLTVTSIIEVASPQFTRFGKASIDKMLAFVDAIAPAQEEKTLRSMLDMYICVSSAAYKLRMLSLSPEAQGIFDEIVASLSRKEDRLSEAISSTMEELRTLMEDDDAWAIEIPQGGGKVHRNTRLMVDCILSITEALDWAPKYARRHPRGKLRCLIDDSNHYLNGLLLRKSELCVDPSMRYLFLLNNSYLVAPHWRLTPECRKYMESYLDVSWGHVIFHLRETVSTASCLDVSCETVFCCIPKMFFQGSSLRRKNASSPANFASFANFASLANFESAFYKTYQAQKLWKVPDPWLRSVLREAITERLISRYRDYLKVHPELGKHVSDRGSCCPEVLEEMLGELFEG